MKYFAILTNLGAAKLANATALGTQLKLTHMATGDGNGTLPTPDPAQTKLVNQKRIAPLNMLFVDPGDANQIIAEQVIPENEGGFWIREIGLYDADGTLIAVANCPETYKPLLLEGSARTQTLRMALVVSATSAVSLKIDPAVVLATRKYADDLLANHLKAANPHTQYAPISNPAFSGVPRAPTPAQTVNSTQIATTEFVKIALTEKQPLNATLSALSGKDVPALLQYLRLDELAQTPRFLVTKGENANGWYEIYSDGYKRVGQTWSLSNPLLIPTPAAGALVSYPISFTTKLNGLYVTENANTTNNFETPQPAGIGMSGFNLSTLEITIGTGITSKYGSTFAGHYFAEGY